MAPRTDTLTLPKPVRRDATRVSPLGLIEPPPIQIESPKFSGSLASLFVCVRDRKVDLLEVPLFPICEAYFAYLIQANLEHLDEAAAALEALAYLLERKAWALLPNEEPEPVADEPFDSLMPSTHEYRVGIEALRRWSEERERTYFRIADPDAEAYDLPVEISGVSLADLSRAFARVLERATPAPPTQPLGKPRRLLSDEMRLVLKRLPAGWASLEALLPDGFTREDAVFGFLAVLELIRLGQLSVRNSGNDVQFAAARKKA